MNSKQGEKKMEMTFEEKYAKSINRLKNTEKPDYPHNQLNNYADFIELLVLFSGQDGISLGDIQDLFFGEPDESTDAERNDNDEAFLKRVFSLIEDRILLYADLYPFKKEKDALFLKEGKLKNEKYYLFFLISSQLDIFKPFLSDLTKDFETLSYEVLQKYIPNAEVRQFGKNTTYKGNTKQKIIALSNEIGIPINNDTFNEIDDENNQDGGLDVIGWLPFDDKCQNKIVFLCQCACGKNYDHKQGDTIKFANNFVFYLTHPQHTLFIPYSLININNGKFYGNHIEEGYLVFERKRMVTFLNGDNTYDKLYSKELIEHCIKHSI